MMLSIYESVFALSSIYNQTPDSVANQLGIYISQAQSCMQIARNTFSQKAKLVDDKKKALTNISNKTKAFSDSNVTVLNNAYEASRRAFEFRLNLELSVLNSELKGIEIEIAKIKLMSADDFTAKYGA